MGLRHGAWCIGCCWALMASLFALGVMSLAWMALVAGLIAFEKLIPSRRAATYGTTAVLLVLGVLLMLAPDAIPALTIPGNGPMSQMDQMSPLTTPEANATTGPCPSRVRKIDVAALEGARDRQCRSIAYIDLRSRPR